MSSCFLVIFPALPVNYKTRHMKPALHRHSVVQACEGRRLTRVVTGNWRVLLTCVWWQEIAGEFAASLPRFCRAGLSG